MRRVAIGAAVAVSACIAFVASIFLMSEFGGEVVTLRSAEPGGSAVATHLWVVDFDGSAWLRAGVPASGWLRRIEADPGVELTRDGLERRFRAVPVRDPATRDRVHALMREKYGLADRWISLLRDASQSVPVRLEGEGAE